MDVNNRSGYMDVYSFRTGDYVRINSTRCYKGCICEVVGSSGLKIVSCSCKVCENPLALSQYNHWYDEIEKLTEGEVSLVKVLYGRD